MVQGYILRLQEDAWWKFSVKFGDERIPPSTKVSLYIAMCVFDGRRFVFLTLHAAPRLPTVYQCYLPACQDGSVQS
jgi:hypothetical protein